MGLTQQQVQERINQGLTNESDLSTDKTTKEIIISNTFTYFNLIFLIITVLLCLVGSFRNLTFLPIVIGNTLIGIIQEIRAKRTLDKMNLLNAPHAIVVRDGVKQKIETEQLVQDDEIILEAGNQICADAVVVEGSVQVNESLLTGEADEVEKILATNCSPEALSYPDNATPNLLTSEMNPTSRSSHRKQRRWEAASSLR